MSCSVPILFIIFNKIEETVQVFDIISRQKPKRLFIAADGPRFEEERAKCIQVREWVLQNIDWDCKVETLFREQNVGCGKGPSQAITWFFEHVEEGIILEDDCVPNDSFFRFCEILLNKYRYDSRISAISGNNFRGEHYINDKSDYYYSIFPSSWGWATWKRAWKSFDINIHIWSSIDKEKLLNWMFKEKKYQLWWKNKFDQIYKEKPNDIWDFQFHFASMVSNQLAIIPKANLVTNIGYGPDATHFLNLENNLFNLKAYDFTLPIKHPKFISRNYEADVYAQDLLFGEVQTVNNFKKIKRYLKRLVLKHV